MVKSDLLMFVFVMGVLAIPFGALLALRVWMGRRAERKAAALPREDRPPQHPAWAWGSRLVPVGALLLGRWFGVLGGIVGAILAMLVGAGLYWVKTWVVRAVRPQGGTAQ